MGHTCLCLGGFDASVLPFLYSLSKSDFGALKDVADGVFDDGFLTVVRGGFVMFLFLIALCSFFW